MRFGRTAWRSAVTAAVVAAGLISVAASPTASAAGRTTIGEAAGAAQATRAVPYRDIGDSAYTGFLGGQVTFTQIDSRTVLMTGQFNEGFYEGEACLLHVGDLPAVTFQEIGATINPPGTSAFEHQFKDTTTDDVTGVQLRVVCDDNVIGTSDATVPA
ncbi:hypothetical protein GCM10010358_68430 [Streptomyces minutiscleroticus]|uniref:Secreted protein n=1 Tax=Streptomyces minutiscleroticus TaxID=68238 RepID=A0A918U723_9ACTN|nr:hypothetical protein [Streptomyces minutiscleroticus]GGY05330.1 hypothetical protein GCM10010358_68430 [Streptomyces minutiscleroticus]